MGPQWLDDPVNRGIWQRVTEIPDNELWRSKERLRDRLVSFVRERLKRQLRRQGAPAGRIAAADEVLDPDILTICFARRFATYKRAYLVLQDLERLKKLILDRDRPIQLIMAGKAHPHDHPGKEIIRQIAQLARDEEFHHRIIFIEDYDMEAARHMVHGADIWLNTPRRPMEASGTSGMKAAINGSLNLSVLDGWWPEAFQRDNGWAIGTGEELEDHTYQDEMESRVLYDLLEREICPLFYQRGPDDVPRDWMRAMKASLESICPQFNTNRMVEEYTTRSYLPAAVSFNSAANDDRSRPRALAKWKARVRDHWGEVQILGVEADIGHEIELGNDLEVEVRVRLGTLTVEDLLVEARHGLLDPAGAIASGQAVACEFESADDGVATYRGRLSCHEAGRHGFTVRVLPFTEQLTNKFETRLLTWWAGSESTSAETVPETVGG